MMALNCSRNQLEPPDGLDLPDGPPTGFRGETADDPLTLDAPLDLGSVCAEQRGVAGRIALGVRMDIRGEWLEVGPHRFSRREAIFLCRLLLVGHALLRAPAR